MFGPSDRSSDCMPDGEVALPLAVAKEAERSRLSRFVRTGLCCLVVMLCLGIMLPMLPNGHERVMAQPTAGAASATEYGNLLPQEDSHVRGGMPLNRHRT